MLETLVHIDNLLSAFFAAASMQSFSVTVSRFLAQPSFWVPWFVFLALLVHGYRPKRAILHGFFLVAGWFAVGTLAQFVDLIMLQMDFGGELLRYRPGRPISSLLAIWYPDATATSFFAISIYLFQRLFSDFKRWRWLLFIPPTLLSFSLLHLQMNFLFDILLSAGTGLLGGWAISVIANGIESSFLEKEQEEQQQKAAKTAIAESGNTEQVSKSPQPGLTSDNKE